MTNPATPSCPSTRSTRSRRLVAAIAALVILALSASACASGSVEIGGASVDGQAAQTSDDTSGDAVEPAQADAADEPRDDGEFGPKPVLQSFSVSAETFLWSGDQVGLDYTFTEVDDRDQNVSYVAIGNGTEIRASYLSRNDTQVQVCIEAGNTCGGGDTTNAPFFSPAGLQISYFAWDPVTIDGPRVAGGILLGEGVGWEISDDNYTFDGRPGRCYTSLGFYQWTGDPEPTETAFPAGDIACVLFYDFGSEYLSSYDFGGDGTIEVQTLRVADSYTEADLVHADYAPAQFEQAPLDELLETVSFDGGVDVITN